MVLRFGPRLYLQHDRGFDYDDEEEESDEESEADDNGKYESAPDKMIPSQNIERSDYEMHHRSTTNDTTTLKNDATRYGATDIEQNTVAQLLQENQRRQSEIANRHGGDENSNDMPPFLSWLTQLLPGKERQQPLNPYQEINRDREIMRMMKKKKSMGRMSSRPSFCT